MAAAEAARLIVISEPAGSGEEAARTLINDIAANAGVSAEDLVVSFCPTGPDHGDGTCGPLHRGDVVTVIVRLRVPAITTPFGEVGGITFSASHSEPVDVYRSLPG